MAITNNCSIVLLAIDLEFENHALWRCGFGLPLIPKSLGE